jgi:hypothetical protein
MQNTPLVHIDKIEYHYHNHIDTADIISLLNILKLQNHKMANELDDLTAKVEANGTVIGSAIVLLKGLKSQLDAAGTDPVKLKALSDSLGSQDNDLAEAIAANTPSA